MDTTKVCYMLRTCSDDGTSSHGFRYPTEVGAEVECPDWDDNPGRDCGGGLHGLPNGIGNASLIPQGGGVWWQVWQVQPGDWFAPVNGKSRWKRGRLLFSRQQDYSTEARDDAITFLRQCGCPPVGIAWDRVTSGYSGQSTSGDFGQSTSGDSGQSTSGCYGQSTSGDSGQSTSGKYGQSTSGDYGRAAAGVYGQSTSGDYGQSTSGDYGQSTSGGYGQSTSGDYGRAAAGVYGGISILWVDKKLQKYRVGCGEVGCGDGSDGLLKANTWYRVSTDGQWVEDGPAEKK